MDEAPSSSIDDQVAPWNVAPADVKSSEKPEEIVLDSEATPAEVVDLEESNNLVNIESSENTVNQGQGETPTAHVQMKEPGQVTIEKPAFVDIKPQTHFIQAAPQPRVDTSVWDKQVAVREGRLKIELSRQEPPLTDARMIHLCHWLDTCKLPNLVSQYPYIKRHGAWVDVSENRIEGEGVKLLLDTMRKHKVPCATLEVYRNILTDSVLPGLVDYMKLQSTSYPMVGLHMSHNRVSKDGCLRLIEEVCKCGHYPVKLSDKPLWLRLEHNEIERPQDILETCKNEGLKACTMQDGECAFPNCNHRNVPVQLPYFYTQKTEGFYETRDSRQTPVMNYGPDRGVGGSSRAHPYGSLITPEHALSMRFVEVTLGDTALSLGFSYDLDQWDGRGPIQVLEVTPGSECEAAGVAMNMVLRRLDGLDVSLLSRAQVEDMLEDRRPLTMRFGYNVQVEDHAVDHHFKAGPGEPTARPRAAKGGWNHQGGYGGYHSWNSTDWQTQGWQGGAWNADPNWQAWGW